MRDMDIFPHVKLRALEPEDLEILYEIENNVALWNVGITNVPYSKFTLHDYILSVTGDIYTDKQVRLMVENKDNEIVGIADVINFDPRHLRAEVSIVVIDKYRNQGYAGSILNHLATYSKNILHLHQLYAFVAETNNASIHLFDKMGYSVGGVLHDWLYDGNRFQNALLVQTFL